MRLYFFLDIFSMVKFCYLDYYCGVVKVDKYYNQVVSQVDCCINGGKGWGVGWDSCIVCVNVNIIGINEV